MSFIAQVQKHCTKLSRTERRVLTRYWLDLPHCIRDIFTGSSKFNPDTQHNMYEYVCHKFIAFLGIINSDLKELGFSSNNNFISAGWAFFSLMLIAILNTPTMSKKDLDNMLQSVKPYIILYIVVDHTLDNDNTVFPVFKQQMAKLIRGEPVDTNVKSVKCACSLMDDIMRTNPKSTPYLLNVAKVEFDSVKLQKSKHDTLKMCYDKGSASTVAGCAIMNQGVIFPGADLIGQIGQLFDDIVDIEEDKNSGICTFVTESLDKYQHIDNVVEVMGNLVAQLPDSYDSAKSWLLYMLCTYFINSMYISHVLRVQLLDYSLLLYKGHNSNPGYFASFVTIFTRS